MLNPSVLALFPEMCGRKCRPLRTLPRGDNWSQTEAVGLHWYLDSRTVLIPPPAARKFLGLLPIEMLGSELSVSFPQKGQAVCLYLRAGRDLRPFTAGLHKLEGWAGVRDQTFSQAGGMWPPVCHCGSCQHFQDAKEVKIWKQTFFYFAVWLYCFVLLCCDFLIFSWDFQAI